LEVPARSRRARVLRVEGGRAPHAVSAHDVPAGGDHVSLGTLCGYPLEPGERVVFFGAPEHTRTKAALIALGIVLAILLFGIFVIIYGVLYERWGLRFVAVTNKRVISQKGQHPPRFVRLDEIVKLRAARPETEGAGGGLAGAAMSAAASMEVAAAERVPKT